MAPSLRASASAVSSSASSVNVTIPAATEGEDWLVLWVMANATPTLPAGWVQIDTQVGTGLSGRIFTKKAAGTAGSASSDASTVVACAASATGPMQVYMAVIAGAVGVRLRDSVRASTISLSMGNQDHPKTGALLVYAGAARVTAATTLNSVLSTVIDQQNSNTAIAGILATRTGPITNTASITASPTVSPGTGSYFGGVVAWDTTTDSVWDHEFTFPPGGANNSITTVRTTGGTFQTTVDASVKAVWVYIPQPSQVGQTLTVAVWASTAAVTPLVSTTYVPSTIGWVRVPLTSWPRITAATTFVVSVSWSGLNVTIGTAVGTYPAAYNRLSMLGGRTSTSATVPVNPATNVTASVYYVDAEITTDVSVEMVGGGAPSVGAIVLNAGVVGGGSITARVPMPVDMTGGGSPETVAWQTEFPAEDVADIDVADLTDPDLYEEPPVLQSTLDMPDPTSIVDGVPVDWEPA